MRRLTLSVLFLLGATVAIPAQSAKKAVDVTTLKSAGAEKSAKLAAMLPPAQTIAAVTATQKSGMEALSSTAPETDAAMEAEAQRGDVYPQFRGAPLNITALPDFTWENQVRFFATTTAPIYGEAQLLVREVTPSGETKTSEAWELGNEFPENVTFDFRKIDFGWPYRTGGATFEVWLFVNGYPFYSYTRIPVRTAVERTLPFITGAGPSGGTVRITGRFLGRRFARATNVVYGFNLIPMDSVDVSPFSLTFPADLVGWLPEQGYPVSVCQRSRCDAFVARHVDLQPQYGKGAPPPEVSDAPTGAVTPVGNGRQVVHDTPALAVPNVMNVAASATQPRSTTKKSGAKKRMLHAQQ